MTTQHGIGIIGAGLMGERMLTALDRDARFVPRAVFDPRRERLEQLAETFSFAAASSEADLFARDDLDARAAWTLQLGGPKWDRAYGVVADDAGAFVTGYTFGEFADNQVGEADAFVARINADGTRAWLNQYGTPALDWGQGGAAAPDGGVYLVGFTEGDLVGSNAGERDAFVMHIDADGAVVDQAQFGSSGLDWATSAVSDDAGLVIVGHTSGDLAGDPLGEADVFVIALDSDLGIRWSVQFGSEAQDQGYGIAGVEGNGQQELALVLSGRQRPHGAGRRCLRAWASFPRIVRPRG